MFVLPFWLLGLPAASQAPADEGVSGHLHFSDGTSVAFTHLGRLDRVWEYSVSGYLGGQRVLYSVSDLKEIIFVSRSEDRTGIFVSKTGERFTVTGLYVRVRDDTTVDVAYVYNDPVTGRRMQSTTRVWGNLTRISLGEDSGDSKWNPTTGEYFPALYVFDPFTGDRLEWANRNGNE